jgi:hypothetical protein
MQIEKAGPSNINKVQEIFKTLKQRCLIWQTKVLERKLENKLMLSMFRHPYYGYYDARLTIYSKVIGIQRAISLGFIFRREHLLEPSWWSGLSYDMKWLLPTDADKLETSLSRYTDEFSDFQTVGFVQGLCSAIEFVSPFCEGSQSSGL